MNYLIFGICLISCGSVLFALHMKHEWNHSKQKAQEEFLKFWYHLEELGIDPKTILEVTEQMKSIEDYTHANRRLTNLKKRAHESRS
jgi:SOS response regulatory protein OraA/RecX